MKNTTRALLACALAIAAGCGGAAQTNDNWRARGTGSRQGPTEVEVAEMDDSCQISTIFFGYDSADLDQSSRAELEHVAACITEGRGLPVQLVGAADPRGTEEYNLALGERRAQTVQRYLVGLGVDPRFASVSTVGEEFARGTGEATWALDRHVEPLVRETSRGLRAPTASLTHELGRPKIDLVSARR
jgi:peptidoglycan-associated lipoprotein